VAQHDVALAARQSPERTRDVDPVRDLGGTVAAGGIVVAERLGGRRAGEDAQRLAAGDRAQPRLRPLDGVARRRVPPRAQDRLLRGVVGRRRPAERSLRLAQCDRTQTRPIPDRQRPPGISFGQIDETDL
jgi:hypothetical protein